MMDGLRGLDCLFREGNMATSGKSKFSAEKLELYEEVLRTKPEIERKGDANPYTSLNGNMFTLLHSLGTLAFRLPEGEREKFLKKYKSSLFEAYGTVMKEYVVVPDSLLKKTGELAGWLEISYSYAGTLRAKASARKAPKPARRPSQPSVERKQQIPRSRKERARSE
jgi:hypothetical protein